MDQETVSPETLTAAVQSGQLSQKDFDSAISKIASDRSSPPGSPIPIPPPVPEGVVVLRDGELSARDAATLAKDISELEVSGKITPEMAEKYRQEAGIVKSEPKPAALAEIERIYGPSATKTTDFNIPPLQGVDERGALESRTLFGKALLASELPANMGNALIEQFRQSYNQAQRWSSEERAVHKDDSYKYAEKRYGADLPAMWERGKSFLQHLDKAAPGVARYILDSGSLDHSSLALDLFLGASEQWHNRQKAKGSHG